MLTQDDHMRKKMTIEERYCQGVQGWRIPQSHLRTEPGLPSLLLLSAMYTTHEILVKAKAAGELVPFLRKIGIYFSVVTKIRENAPDKPNDLWLFLESPKDFCVPKGHLERYHVAVLQALISLDKLRRHLYCFKG